MINTIEIKWDLLGAKLAALSDVEQAEFFKGFASELRSWESTYIANSQIIATGEKLSDNDKKTLEAIMPCLWEKY